MKRFAIFLSFLIALTSFPSSEAAVKAGASCKKIGSTTVISGKKYTCIKSGKKLIWNKGIKIQKQVETKSEIPISTTLSNSGSTSTPSQALDPKYPKQGDSCPNKSPDVIGYDQQGLFVDLMCNEFDNRYFPRPENLGAFKVDPKTGVRIKGEMQGTQQVIEWKEPKDISSTNLSTITPRSELADLNLCKIKDAAADGMSLAVNQKHFVSGFGLYEERAPLTRSPVIQFVTVDFADLPGKRTPTEDLKPITDFLGKYWKSQTTNGIELEFRIPEKYIRMPQNVVDYGMNVDFFSGKWKSTSAFDYVRAALKVVDSQIDFTNVDVIAIVVPAEVKRDQIAAFVAESSEKAAGQGFDTAEKRIYNTLIMAGPTNTPDFELLNWAHELGHNFGLTDIRNTQNVAAQDSSDLGIYDLMNSMLAPELLAWNRFIIGILNDDQVRCVNSGITTHLIKPVEMNTKENKLVVIPTGKYQAIAVETRRAIGFDATMGSKSEGVLVYTIDTTIPYNLSPMKLVPRVGSTDTVWRRDSALKLGDSLTVQGWKISVIESGDFGDVVKVEKTS